MKRKSIIGGLVGLLLLTGIIGSNLVLAANQQVTRDSVKQSDASDDDDLECPAQGLPACEGQMNDDKNEGPENEADDKNEGPENEADEADEGPDQAENGSK